MVTLARPKGEYIVDTENANPTKNLARRWNDTERRHTIVDDPSRRSFLWSIGASRRGRASVSRMSANATKTSDGRIAGRSLGSLAVRKESSTGRGGREESGARG